MLARNPHIASLEAGYLFPEINKRKKRFLEKNPNAELISLGIGDTTEPLSPSIIAGLIQASNELGAHETYSGYGPEQGIFPLREAIARELYSNRVEADEVFISDGAKCDAGRLQILFGEKATIAVQDPVYPVYHDTAKIVGQTTIHKMPCTAENNFFPDTLPQADVLFICSPNNPTGATATRSQLEWLVENARKQKSLIVFDAAYSAFITDPAIPRSIYEIPGSREIAIEVNSFSKNAGFTGVRLGWTIVPKEITYRDGGLVHTDWSRIVSTFFNGASILAQKAACCLLTPEGRKETSKHVSTYLENAALIKDLFTELGWTCYGGTHIPYVWAKGNGQTSWELFDQLLENTGIVITPGSGFGHAGEGYIRISGFASRKSILRAREKLFTFHRFLI